jgi:glycosyltransferase involved in cell wall biosynthesis
MRRILIFSLVYYPRFVGGAEVAVKNITDNISSDEASFDMITMRTEKKSREKIGNIDIYRIGIPWYGNPESPVFFLLKYVFMPWGLMWALRLHARNHYDVIWSIMANYASAPAMCFKFLRPKTKFVLSLHEGDPMEHIRRRVGVTYPVFKRLFATADHIQAVSTYLADWANRMGARCPVSVIPDAVDYALFSTRRSVAEELSLARELGKCDGDVIMITTSRLAVKNAVGDIIEALQYLPSNVKLLILGQGNEEKKLKAQSTCLNLCNRVQFLGFVPHTDMPRYLHVSDIFVRPSLSEGLGISFLEAMAAGIPVIATSVGGIPDFLVDGDTGFFCETNNPKSIAQKVEMLIKDRESRDHVVGQARKMVQERYSWGTVAARMRDIVYDSCAG